MQSFVIFCIFCSLVVISQEPDFSGHRINGSKSLQLFMNNLARNMIFLWFFYNFISRTRIFLNIRSFEMIPCQWRYNLIENNKDPGSHFLNNSYGSISQGKSPTKHVWYVIIRGGGGYYPISIKRSLHFSTRKSVIISERFFSPL